MHAGVHECRLLPRPPQSPPPLKDNSRMSTSLGRLAGGALAATFARGLLKLIIAGCFALFNYVGFAWITDDYYVKFAAGYDTWGMKYPRSGAWLPADVHACMRAARGTAWQAPCMALNLL